LLHYENGTGEVLGQWRFDHVIDAMGKYDVPHSIHFYLGFVEGIPCVKNICFNLEEDHTGWVTIVMRGCLVWWFSELGGYVVHKHDV
jgi:hypothetical protein